MEPVVEQTRTRSFAGGILQPAQASTFAPGTLTERALSQRWFSGAFKYYIPSGDGTLDKFARWRSDAQKLLGYRVTPETLWNLAPWSWAADWFGNTGAVMTNISNLGSDGLVLEYGYVMHKTLASFVVTNVLPDGSIVSRQRETKTLNRLPATPYGFGIDVKKLSARQTAVIVALGLSHG
jgi:hypothetical protein